MMFKYDMVTNAFCGVSTWPPSIRTKVVKDATATRNGTEVQMKEMMAFNQAAFFITLISLPRIPKIWNTNPIFYYRKGTGPFQNYCS